MTGLYVGEKLHRIEVQDAPSIGAPDLPGEWAVLSFREDARGCFVRTTYYPSERAATTAAQHMRAEENPRCPLAVYCSRCHTRKSFLFEFVCCACQTGGDHA